jgi:hypothetical protein
VAKPSKAAIKFAYDQLAYGTNQPAARTRNDMPWIGLTQGQKDREWLEERARMWSTDPVALADFVGTLGKNLHSMPANSGGFVFSTAYNGMTLDSPGVPQLSQYDSENVASTWLNNSRPPNTSAAGLENVANPKHSIGSWLGERWDDAFEGMKNTTRNLIVGVSAPFEAVTGGIRSAAGEVQDNDWVGAAVALAGIVPGVEKAAEAIDPERFDKPGAWEQTHLATSLGQYGQAVQEGQGVLEAVGAGQGDGWLWVDPEQGAGEEQRRLAYEAARVQFEDGSPAEAWTVGRGLMSVFTEGPDDQAYRIGSGIVDLAAAVLLDPITYIAPYAKAAQGRRALQALNEAGNIAQAEKAGVVAGQLADEGLGDALKAAEDLGATPAELAAAQRALMREQYRRMAARQEITEDELAATETVLDSMDEALGLDPYGPAYQQAADTLARGLQYPQGYQDNMTRLQGIDEEIDYLSTRRSEMLPRRGQGRITLDPDPTDAIDSVVRTWGAESVDAAYGRMSTAASNLGETHKGRWAGVVTYTPPSAMNTWMPAVTRDGEILLTYKPGASKFVDGAEPLTGATRQADEGQWIGSTTDRLANGVDDAQRTTEGYAAPRFRRAASAGRYEDDVHGYTIMRSGKSDWELFSSKHGSQKFSTLTAAKQRASELEQHLAWRRKQGLADDATRLTPQEAEGLGGDILAAFRGTFSDEMVETFANPRTATQKRHAKVYRGLEELLQRPDTTWERLLNYASEMGVTNRLAITLREVGIDGIDNVGAALGTPEASLRWVANDGVLKATAIDETGRARLARMGLSEVSEQRKVLMEERGVLSEQQRLWDADIDLQQRQLADADELVRLAEDDAARLDELLGGIDDAENSLARLAQEREPMEAAYRMGLRENDAYSAMLRALGFKIGTNVDWASAAHRMDIDKARDFFANSAMGKLVLKAISELDSPGKIAVITRHRFDDQLVRDLAGAKTEEEALAALWFRLGENVVDPLGDARSAREAARALGSTEGLTRRQQVYTKVGSNPMYRRLASFVPSGRHLELNDPQQMSRELENFGRNMKLSDDEIGQMLDGLYAATTHAGRRQAAYDAMAVAQSRFVDALDAKNLSVEARDHLKARVNAALRLSQKEGDEQALYLQERTALTGGKTPEMGLVDEKGDPVEWPDAFTDAEFIQGTIPLPDSVQIHRAVSKAAVLYEREAFDTVAQFLDTAFNDVWRTAMLAFRPSYIIRNTAEMEMRMFLQGHSNTFSNPLASAGMFFASRQYRSPKLEALRKSFDAFNRGGMRYSATGEDFMAAPEITTAQARMMSDAMLEHRAVVEARYSLGDYRMKAGVMGDTFGVKTVTSTNDKFIDALSQQFLIRRSGAIDQIAIGGDGGYQSLRNLRIDYAKRGFSEEDATVAWFTGHPEGAQLVEALRDASPAIGHMLSDPDLARGYLYDWDHSVREWVRIFTNNGDDELVDAFISGKVRTGNGKQVFLDNEDKPWVRERIIASMFRRKGVDQRLNDAFSTEGLPWWDRSSTASGKASQALSRATEAFFEVSAKIERSGAMGPEWKWSYWEEIGRRAALLDAESLARVTKIAESTLPGGRRFSQARNIVTGRTHPALDALRRAKGEGILDVSDIEKWASHTASKHVEDLFYQAQNRNQFWHSTRLIFPFGQAWGNSARVWGLLGAKNPYQVYRFARAWRALTADQSSAAYDALDPFNDHPTNEGGFFYRDEFRDNDLMFKYPTWLTSLGGALPYDEAMEMAAPVSSLNLAFGGDVPLPGVGPLAQLAVSSTGIDEKPTRTGALIRSWAVPFGAPDYGETGAVESLAPTWSRYAIFGAIVGNDAFTRSQLKGAATYLAQEPGRFSDLADEEQSRQYMEDAWGVARMATFFRGIGSLLLPASPQLRWKSPDMGGEYHWIEQIADDYRRQRQFHGNDAGTSIFLDQYGDKNIVAALSLTNGQEVLDTPAWEFYQANQEVAEDIGLETLNLLFPGDVSFDAVRYFRDAGIRDYATTQEMANQASRLLYDMEQARAVEKYVKLGWSKEQYEAYTDMIDDKFGGAPIQSIDPAVDDRKERGIEKALELPEVQALPQYPLLFETWATYKQALWDYQQRTGNDTATLKGKGAAPWREAVYNRFDQILDSSRELEPETGTLGAAGLISWIQRRLMAPRDDTPEAEDYQSTPPPPEEEEEYVAYRPD